MSRHFDPNHPLHRASFYVEDLKWGPGNWGRAEPVENPGLTATTRAELAEILARVFADAGIDLDPLEFTSEMDYYAASFSRMLGVSQPIAQSILSDAIMFGIAIAAGLKGDVPAMYQEGGPE